MENKENQKQNKYMNKRAKELTNSYNDEFFCNIELIRITLKNLKKISKKLMEKGEYNKKELIATFNKFSSQYKQLHEIVKILVE